MQPEKSIAERSGNDRGVCNGCANLLEPDALICVSCGRLTRGDELRTLSAEAQAAAAAGNPAQARDLWIRAAGLLPENTLQHRSIQTHIADLETQLATGAAGHSGWWARTVSALGPLGILLWKFKALLFGLTKLTTLFSIFAFFGVYWTLYGWAFALGLVLSIYIHEMGHVIAIRGFGMPASAPMFIPGFGAFISLRARSITRVQDARIGLAGPVYGLGAALLSLALFKTTHIPVFRVIAQFGATINLFNLIPVWQLDGSRGFHSLTQRQRMIATALAFGLAIVFRQGMLFLVGIGAVYRLFTKDAAPSADWRNEDRTCLLQYSMLLIALAVVAAKAMK